VVTPSGASSDTLAAVDIGTNSLHGVVARMTPGDAGPRFEILEREKEIVRLGSSGGDMRELTADAIDRAVAALDRFRQVAEVHGAPITAVATSAVREAENRDVLIDRAWDEAHVRVTVISGVEEARLIHLGVLQAVPDAPGTEVILESTARNGLMSAVRVGPTRCSRWPMAPTRGRRCHAISICLPVETASAFMCATGRMS